MFHKRIDLKGCPKRGYLLFRKAICLGSAARTLPINDPELGLITVTANVSSVPKTAKRRNTSMYIILHILYSSSKTFDGLPEFGSLNLRVGR